jgi:ATP-binding cassette, subfamily B, bacterial
VHPHSVTKFIFSVIKPFRWWVCGQVLVSVIWAVDLSIRPYLLKMMVDLVASTPLSQAYDALFVPAFLYFTMLLVVVLMFRFYDYAWLNINPPMKKHIGSVLMDRMMQHSHHLFQDNFSGSLANKIKDVMSGIPDLLKMLIDHFFSHSLALLIAIGAVSTISAKYALALLIWAILFIATPSIALNRARQLSDDSAEVRSKVVGTMVDILGNMLSVRLFAGRRFENNKLEEGLNDYVRADQKRDWLFLKINAIQGMSFVLYQSLVLYWLIEGFRQELVLPGDFVLVLAINTAIIPNLWTISKDLISVADLAGNITQGLRIVLSPLEIEDKPGIKELIVNKGEIVFSQVHFRYRDAEAIFENKSVTIQPGQKVGLVGYSGGGKTTFVNLILRLFDVTGGHILIDGQDIKEVSQDSLHLNIGMIPQDPLLFHRSLLDNIRYGRWDATDREVMEAAKKAHANEFIENLPRGYHSFVGERGVKLSGGQRQRIAIARAILKNAPILLMDEATSQLDSVTEQYIQDVLWKLMKAKTTIVIAHRLSTLLHMDRILVFDNGKIIEDGTHQELLDKRGHYKLLWDTQVGGFLPEYKEQREI